ncbi:MAG: hypothetical protein ACHRHE_06085 [Tepidisphaerales bacterium]
MKPAAPVILALGGHRSAAGKTEAGIIAQISFHGHNRKATAYPASCCQQSSYDCRQHSRSRIRFFPAIAIRFPSSNAVFYAATLP